MLDRHYIWQTLPNPFLYTDISNVVMGRVSGRSTDIKGIVTGRQSALVLSGAPRIGKTALIHRLQVSPKAEWSWRQEGELVPLRDLLALDHLYFVQINLTPLESIKNVNEMLVPFVAECTNALHRVYQPDQHLPSDGLKGLRQLLRHINQTYPESRCFVLLDAIERLDLSDMPFPELENSEAQTPQERGIALLNYCGAIRTLVDLIDEFSNFGVILSIQSLPRPKIVDQFVHVSADLARFTTTPLQSFTWNGATTFLEQKPEDFGNAWAQAFRDLGGDAIFSRDEQEWIREQAGTHPYLLQQFCLQTFDSKKVYADVCGHWTELQESDKKQLIEVVNVRVSTFLIHLWKRLNEALEKVSPEMRNNFYEFIHSFISRQAGEEIPVTMWDRLGSDLRYILSNEGIIRYDLFQPVHYPGSLLRRYLIQKVGENSTATARGFWLTITRPESQRERLSLSELEYRLIKMLIQHPKRCSEDDLMKAAWGRIIERTAFTQRMHHLRKKLREHSGDTEVITNHYGGLYSLNYPEWFRVE